MIARLSTMKKPWPLIDIILVLSLSKLQSFKCGLSRILACRYQTERILIHGNLTYALLLVLVHQKFLCDFVFTIPMGLHISQHTVTLNYSGLLTSCFGTVVALFFSGWIHVYRMPETLLVTQNMESGLSYMECLVFFLHPYRYLSKILPSEAPASHARYC